MADWTEKRFRMSRLISTVMLLIVTLVVGVLFYQVMVGFFVPLFLAALLVVIFRPVHEWIGLRLGGRPRLAAVLTTTTIMVVVLLPAITVIAVAAAQGTTMLSQVNYNTFSFALERTREQLGLEVDNIEPFERLPEVIMSLSEIEDLDDPRIRQKASDRLYAAEQLLLTLKNDFTPLSSVQENLWDDASSKLQQMQQQLTTLDIGVVPTPTVNAGSATSSSGEEGEQASEQSLGGASGGAADQPAPESETEDAKETTDYRSPEERFQRTLIEFQRVSQNLSNQLLGGSVRGQLKLLANPSRDELANRIEQARQYIQPRLVSVTSATGEFLIQLLIGLTIMVITIYFFLVDGPAMVRTLMRLSPLDDRYEHRLLLEFDRTSRAVVLATVLSALAQGVLATAGYYAVGLNSIALLFLLTSFMALIPFLGAASIWLPCSLWLLLVEERMGAAIGLAIFGAVCVSSVDNVIKVFVLHGRSQLHPLLALLSVLGGVQVFGPIGILVGPMVVVFLQSTLEILNHELSNLEEVNSEGKEDGPELAMAGAGDTATPVVTEASKPATNPGKVGKKPRNHRRT